MSTPLFSGSALQDHLPRVTEQRRSEAGALEAEELADRAAALARICPPVAGQVPVLRRDEAEFRVTDHGNTGTVEVLIPFSGSGAYFHMNPAQRPDSSPPPLGTWDRFGAGDHVLVLDKRFDSGTTKDDVRAWAKSETDRIEAYLQRLRAEASEAHGEMRATVEEAIEQRARALSSFRSLQEELGKGI
jgi:hypothetical protein